MFRSLTRLQLVVDVVAAGLFVLVALPLDLSIGRFTDNNALGTVLVVVVMGAALGLRRAAPGLALAVAWVGAILQMGLGRPPSAADIAIFGVLYTTAAYGTRRTFWAGFASTLLGGTVIALYLFAPVAQDGELSITTVTTAVAVAIAAMFGLGLAWTAGALVRTGIRARENRVAQQIAEAETAAEAERLRIARDMHDVVAHSLAVVIAQADGARYVAAADPVAASAALDTIALTARAALSDVRMLLTQLRHPHSLLPASTSAPGASGEPSATEVDGPQPTLADLEQLYAQVRGAGVRLRVDVDPAPRGDEPASVQLAVYRILQEALTNALRHGMPDGGVDVALAWHDGQVLLSVSNDLPETGSRESEQPAAREREQFSDPSRGHGLIGMRERAQLVGGTLDAGPDGRGRFVVRATLPISARAEETP